jgi:hypothetical protein
MSQECKTRYKINTQEDGTTYLLRGLEDRRPHWHWQTKRTDAIRIMRRESDVNGERKETNGKIQNTMV